MKLILVIKDVSFMMPRVSHSIKSLLQRAYQNNLVTTLIFNDVTYTGTVDFLSATTVYLGLSAGRTQELPLAGVHRVQLHQSQSWWYLYDQSPQ